MTSISVGVVLPVIISASVCGVAGGIFGRVLLWPLRQPQNMFWSFRRQHAVLFAGVCGTGVSLLAFLSHGAISGSGYHATQSLLAGGNAEAWSFAPMKFMATLLSYFSGVPGGIFPLFLLLVRLHYFHQCLLKPSVDLSIMPWPKVSSIHELDM